jgi:hypothetical protein
MTNLCIHGFNRNNCEECSRKELIGRSGEGVMFEMRDELNIALDPLNKLGDDEVLCYVYDNESHIYFLDRPLAVAWAWKRGFPLFTRDWNDIIAALDYAKMKFGRVFDVINDDRPEGDRITQLHLIAAKQALGLP